MNIFRPSHVQRILQKNHPNLTQWLGGLILKTMLFALCFSLAFAPPWGFPPLAGADEVAQSGKIAPDWTAMETAVRRIEKASAAPQALPTAPADISGSVQQKVAPYENDPAALKADLQRGQYEDRDDEVYTRDGRERQSDQVRNSLISQGAGQLTEIIGRQLNNRGQARLDIGLNDDGKLDWSGDILLPLWEGENSMIFTQLGGRTMANDRTIVNLGLGQRFFFGEDFMLGYNGFYDYDISRQHSRAGLGAEIAHDWIRLSANGYWPLSDWKESTDFDDYNQERPARGWDVRAKAYIPSYRQIALTGDYTQWYGEVAALGGRPTQDPQIISYGVEYTPVPLLTTYVRQRHSSGSRQSTEVGLTFNWNFGLSAAEQMDPTNVELLHSFTRNRYDFVDRENEIVLAYRNIDQGLFRLQFLNVPDKLQVGVPATLQVAMTRDGNPWPDESVLWSFLGNANQGLPNQPIPTDGSGLSEITIVPEKAGNLTIRASARGQVEEKTVTVESQPVELTLESDVARLTVGETGALTLSLTVGGADWEGAEVDWSLDNNGLAVFTNKAAKTDKTGTATADLTGLSAGQITITAKVKINGQEFSVDHAMEVLADPLSLTLRASASAMEIGNKVQLTLELKKNGVGQEAVPVTWKITAGDTFGTLQTMVFTTTGGQATAELEAVSVGRITVTVEAEVDGRHLSASTSVDAVVSLLAFTTDPDLSASPAAIRVGEFSTLTFSLDRNGTPLEENVSWRVSSGGSYGKLTVNDSRTNASGKATATLEGQAIGRVEITATVTIDGQPRDAIAVVQVQNDPVLFTLSNPNSELMVGNTQQLTASLTRGGAGVSGSVNWEIISGGSSFGTLDKTVSQTNANSGQATATITAKAFGDATVRASVVVDGQTLEDFNTFNVRNNPPVVTLDLDPDSSTVPVGDSVDLLLTATRNGEALANVTIDSWTVIDGNTLATVTGDPATGSDGKARGTLNVTGAGPIVIEVVITTADGAKGRATVSVTADYGVPVFDLTGGDAVGGAVSMFVGETKSLGFSVAASNGGALLKNLPVTWSMLEPGYGTLGTGGADTGTTGEAANTFKATKAGLVTVEAKVELDGNSYSAFFHVTIADRMVYDLAVAPASVVVGIPGTLTLTVSQNGANVTENVLVNWSLSDESIASLGAETNLTSGSATATASLTAQAAGLAGLASKPLTALASFTINGTTYTASESVDIRNNRPEFSLSADTRNPTVDGDVHLSVTVTRNGEAVTNETVTWTIDPAGAGTITPGGNTDGSGNATATLHVTAVGTVTVTASVTLGGVTYPSYGLTITVQNLPPVVTLTAADPSIEESATTTLRLLVTQDAAGNPPVSGATVAWAVKGSGLNPGTVNGNLTTDANGEATATLTAGDEGVATVDATVTVDGQPYSKRVQVQILPAGSGLTMSLIADPPTIYVGGTTDLTFTLKNSGSPVSPPPTVTWTVDSTDEGGSFPSRDTDTNASGVATATFTATKTGTAVVMATVTVGPTTVTARATVVVQNYPLTLDLSPSLSTIQVDGTSALTASLKRGSSPVNNQAVTWSFITNPSTGVATLAPLSQNTGTASAVTNTLTGKGAGTVTVTATATLDGDTASDTVDITVENQAPVLNLTVDNKPTFYVTEQSTDTRLFTVAVWQNSHQKSGVPVKWTVSTGGKLESQVNTTNANGEATATVSSTVPGQVTVTATATVDGKESSKSKIVTAAYRDPQLYLSGIPKPFEVNDTTTLTFRMVRDGADLPGQTISWSIDNSTVATLTPVSSTTNASGEATATLKGNIAGNFVVKVTTEAIVNGAPYPISQPGEVVNQTPDITLTGTIPDPFEVNSTATLSLSATQNGSPMKNQPVSWSSTNTALGTVSGGGTGAAGEAATATVTAKAAGTFTVTATTVVDGTAYPKTRDITVANQHPELALTAPVSTLKVNDNTTLNLTAEWNDKPLVGENVTWTVSGPGTLSSNSSTTVAGGTFGTSSNVLTATGKGSITVTAAVTADGHAHYAKATVTGENNPPEGKMTIGPDVMQVGNTVPVNLVVTQNGQPLPNTAIRWEVSDPSIGTLVNMDAAINNGTAKGSLRLDAAGDLYVTGYITVDGTDYDVTNSAPVEVKNQPPVLALTTTSSGALISLLGATITFTLTITQNGKPLPGVPVEWTGGGITIASLKPTSEVTDSTGQATAVLTNVLSLFGSVTATALGQSETKDLSLISLL